MDLLVALALFCLVTLFTPGPNNLMLMTSGLNFGVRRGMPHLPGVVFGFTLMVLIVGFGLGAIFEAWPLLYVVLKYAGAAYLLYLAWQIAVSPAPGQSGSGAGRPIGFVMIIAALFGMFGVASSGTWLGFGAGLQRVLKAPRAVRVFNVVMALLLVASLYPIFADGLPGSAP